MAKKKSIRITKDMTSTGIKALCLADDEPGQQDDDGDDQDAHDAAADTAVIVG